jgi:hypothetical protein
MQIIMLYQLLHVLAVQFALLQTSCALRIASSLQWIEHTPQPYAIKNFYKGSTAATLTSGGVANLGSDPKNFDLAANAETQGLSKCQPNNPIPAPLTPAARAIFESPQHPPHLHHLRGFLPHRRR